MIFNILEMDLPFEYTLALLVVLPLIVMCSLSFHEFLHALTAYMLGDPTAKQRGRITLNPLHHLDPIGSVFMLLIGFGWAKPVPINTRYFKNPRKGVAISAAAGPLGNLSLGFCAATAMATVQWVIKESSLPFGETTIIVLQIFYLLLYLIAMCNIALGIFNFFPIPPLDGSKVLFIFLSSKTIYKLIRYRTLISILFFLLLIYGAFSLILGAAVSGFINFSGAMVYRVLNYFLK